MHGRRAWSDSDQAVRAVHSCNSWLSTIFKGFRLENNIFCFNNFHFKQEEGTIMGTKIAPVFASFTIGCMEEKLEVNYDANFYHCFKCC